MQQEITTFASEAKGSALDEVDVTLLDLLQSSGRMSMAELARRVGMSPPGVAERLRRLQSSGVICDYAARVDPTPASALARELPSTSRRSSVPGFWRCPLWPPRLPARPRSCPGSGWCC